jgi:hypothetical protein
VVDHDIDIDSPIVKIVIEEFDRAVPKRNERVDITLRAQHKMLVSRVLVFVELIGHPHVM